MLKTFALAFVAVCAVDVAAQDAVARAADNLRDALKKPTPFADVERAVCAAQLIQSDRVLDVVLEQLPLQPSADVRCLLVDRLLRKFPHSQGAADGIVTQLKKELELDLQKRDRALVDACIHVLSTADRMLARARVNVLHLFLKEAVATGVAEETVAGVVEALGRVRHKLSMEPLLELLERIQSQMREWIAAENPDKRCDGG